MTGSSKMAACRGQSFLLGPEKGLTCPCFTFANESSLWLASQPFISPPGSEFCKPRLGGGGGSSCYSVLEGESLPSLSEKTRLGQEGLLSTPAQAGPSQVPPPPLSPIPITLPCIRSDSRPGDSNTCLTPKSGSETHNLPPLWDTMHVLPGAHRAPGACPPHLSCLHILITPSLHLYVVTGLETTPVQSLHLPGAPSPLLFHPSPWPPIVFI